MLGSTRFDIDTLLKGFLIFCSQNVVFFRQQLQIYNFSRQTSLTKIITEKYHENWRNITLCVDF